jgi:hypothetical protein
VKQQFAPELAKLSPAESAVVLAGADVLTSFESLELMRASHKLTSARAAAAIKGSLARLLPD